MLRVARLLGGAVLCTLLAVGCGKKTPAEAAGDTPEAAGTAFVQALVAGDTRTAAAYWAYDAQARQDNPDWDSFPPGQRSQIKAKLRDEKASELKSSASVLAGAGRNLEAVTQGDQVTVSADGKPLAMVSVVRTDKGYQVSGFAPAR